MNYWTLANKDRTKYFAFDEDNQPVILLNVQWYEYVGFDDPSEAREYIETASNMAGEKMTVQLK